MNIQIEMGFDSERKPIERTEKGKSLIAFPTDYTVIDIETTGLDLFYNSIIEVSAIRVRNSEVQDKFSSLIKPPKHYSFEDSDYYYVDEFITKLTGITNEMLDDAPEVTEVLPEFVESIGDDILIGHNVIFDINFPYAAIGIVTGQPL
jgi:DNA polymerase-3 subunit epsilon